MTSERGGAVGGPSPLLPLSKLLMATPQSTFKPCGSPYARLGESLVMVLATLGLNGNSQKKKYVYAHMQLYINALSYII